eukprot:Sspe_Gene.111288::Locus_93056_Transcript_2_2_Confidence_0.667_Length_333::g.111288::m.111288
MERPSPSKWTEALVHVELVGALVTGCLVLTCALQVFRARTQLYNTQWVLKVVQLVGACLWVLGLVLNNSWVFRKAVRPVDSPKEVSPTLQRADLKVVYAL